MKHTEQLKQHLKQHRLRLTSERQTLAGLVLALNGHFGVDDLLDQIKRRRLNVSRATVYRMLPVMVGAGLIQSSLLSEGVSQYEVVWNRSHHDHLICSVCRKVVEFQDRKIEELQTQIAAKYGFVLEHHIMELVGRCGKCSSVRQ